MKSLKFYDVKKKSFFVTDKYTIRKSINRGRNINIAYAKSPSGITATRILGAD
jgi:hypothetical protein